MHKISFFLHSSILFLFENECDLCKHHAHHHSPPCRHHSYKRTYKKNCKLCYSMLYGIFMYRRRKEHQFPHIKRENSFFFCFFKQQKKERSEYACDKEENMTIVITKEIRKAWRRKKKLKRKEFLCFFFTRFSILPPSCLWRFMLVCILAKLWLFHRFKLTPFLYLFLSTLFISRVYIALLYLIIEIKCHQKKNDREIM